MWFGQDNLLHEVTFLAFIMVDKLKVYYFDKSTKRDCADVSNVHSQIAHTMCKMSFPDPPKSLQIHFKWKMTVIGHKSKKLEV